MSFSVLDVKPENVRDLYQAVRHTELYTGDAGWKLFKDDICKAVVTMVVPFGIIRMTDYVPGVSIQAHGIFWSKDLYRGIDDLLRCFRFAFSVFYTPCIDIIVPATSKSLQRLMKQLPFNNCKLLPNYYIDGILKTDGYLYRFVKEDLL